MMNAVVKPYHEMCLNSSELIVPRDTYQRALHPARVVLHRPEFSLRKLCLFLLKTFVHHTSYGCMDWFTNAKQANIRRETYTSQLMKGGHFTMNLPLFISSANFLLMKSLLLVLFQGLCSLLGLTAQQKIH